MWLLQGINSFPVLRHRQHGAGADARAGKPVSRRRLCSLGFWHNAEPDRAHETAKLLAETNARGGDANAVPDLQTRALPHRHTEALPASAAIRRSAIPRRTPTWTRSSPGRARNSSRLPPRRPPDERVYSWSRFALRTAAAASGIEGRPTKLNFVITKRCYSRCVYCDIWKVKDTPGVSTASFRWTRCRLSPPQTRNLQWIDFTGGEPTTGRIS